MEKPYTGQAIFQDNITELQIIIPGKRSWITTIFLSVWLCFWLFGEVSVVGMLIGDIRAQNFVSIFLLFWLSFWTFGGFIALRTLLWNLLGKEVITVGQGTLTIHKKGALLIRPKVYDLNDVRNIRAQEDNYDNGRSFKNRRTDFGPFAGGTIRFDYGLKTVKFANGIDEAEGRFIISKLKDRRLLSEKNFN